MLPRDRRQSHIILPRLALLAAALIWGSSFVMMKNAVAVFPTHLLLASRFSVACLILCVVFIKRLPRIDKDYLRKTALAGFCLYLAYTFQTIGIRHTTPGKNAFLTGVYVVIVPFLFWFAGKRKPAVKNILAALICLAGVSLISIDIPAGGLTGGGLEVNIGDALTLVGGFFYSAHMVCLALFTEDKDPILLTILQFAYCAAYFGLSSILTEALPEAVNALAILNVLYLAVFCTAVALLFQTYGQKYASPSSASLIMSLEAVFGVLFSVAIYGEQLTLKVLIGFALIFAAIIVSETRAGWTQGWTKGSINV